MKKVLFIAVAASVAFAACTKNEVRSVESQQEITYKTISTKAATGYLTSNNFYSWAWYVSNGETWSSATTKTAYISASQIDYDSANKYWKNATVKYYWPKDGGSLTFFAYAENSHLDSKPTYVTCTSTDGIKITDYDFVGTGNMNKDLLVASIAANKKANPGSTILDDVDWTANPGVPTCFFHVLSSLKFNAKVGGDYGKTTTKIELESLSMKNIYTEGTYTQGVNELINPIYKDASNHAEWDVQGKTASTTAIKFYTPATALELNETPEDCAPNVGTDYSIVLPQQFNSDDAVLEIKYKITTNYGVAATQTITETKKLRDIYPNGWWPGYEYTLGITITLNEILWDPTVEEWASGTVTGVTL